MLLRAEKYLPGQGTLVPQHKPPLDMRELPESRMYVSSDVRVCTTLPHENLKTYLLSPAAFQNTRSFPIAST